MTSLTLILLSLYLGTGVRARYHPSWLIKIAPARQATVVYYANSLAQQNGLVNVGQVGQLNNVFQFRYPQGNRQSYPNITATLQNDNQVVYVEQEQSLNHVKRNFSLPSDPYWQYQWPWYNTGQSGGPSDYDLNVVPVWIEGISGANTAVLVIDDGIQTNHPDLQDNIDLSLCFSVIRNNSDISAISSFDDFGHGTSCAGEIAMIRDNGVCGTGVAFNTRVGGFQVDFSDFLTSYEVKAFGFRSDVIQVYSNSWGPNDNGFTVQGPGPFSYEALYKGITNGRNGKGSIYIFSSGNGGHNGDSCAADGYASNIYTIAVGSANQLGEQAYYDEDCSAKMAVTYSYNSFHASDQVATTFPSSECVRNFTGTSASAPLLAGVILLALEVNSNLSWRDVQYLIAYTSNTANLEAEFVTNGAGLKVSHEFGFGAIDAGALVTRARYWTPVGEGVNLTEPIISEASLDITKDNPYKETKSIHSWNGQYLEHVILEVTFDIITSSRCYYEGDYNTNPFVVNHSGPRRGDTSIVLCSPHGTCSTLLPQRPRDFVNCQGYPENWPFMSVHFWGENPIGNWTVEMSFDSDTGSARLESMNLVLFAVPNKPEDIVAQCDPACATPTGCSYGNGSQYCDACGNGYYRNATMMECVRSCSPSACIIEDTCVFYNGTCPQTATSGLTLKDIIIIAVVSSVLGITCLVLLCVCVVLCCICCPEKKYRQVSIRDGVEESSYQPYDDVKTVVTV